MNQRIRQQIEQLKKVAAASKGKKKHPTSVKRVQVDGLSVAIRTKKEAHAFMSNLKASIEVAQRTQ